MKFAKLFNKIQEYFHLDEETRDEQEQELLRISLEEKCEQIREKLKTSPSKSKTRKLKKKLDILLKLKEKL